MSEVIALVQGGLGNQLFIYAQARSMADRANGSLTMDSSFFSKDRVYKRIYLLDNFCVRIDKEIPRRSDLRTLIIKLIIKFCRNRFIMVFNYFFEPYPSKFLPEIISWCGNRAKLIGYWQCEDYFKDNIFRITDDFRLLKEAEYCKTTLAQEIMNTSNSVFLHYRSYREVPGNSDGSFAMPAQYFNSAIQKVSELIPNPVFFLFSDDHDWVSSRLVVPNTINIRKVSNQDVNIDSTLFEFFLMTLCNHGIIANSSYSWWGGWLCERKNLEKGIDSLIFCPPKVSDSILYSDRWISIEY